MVSKYKPPDKNMIPIIIPIIWYSHFNDYVFIRQSYILIIVLLCIIHYPMIYRDYTPENKHVFNVISWHYPEAEYHIIGGI